MSPVCHQSSYLGCLLFHLHALWLNISPEIQLSSSIPSCCFCVYEKWRYSREEVTETSVTSPLHHSRSVSISFFSLQSAVTIGGPQHAEELQCERRDLHAGAHRRQPVRHSAGHGRWRQQEETVQPQRSCGGHRWQPTQPQHFTDQRARWVATAYPTSCVCCDCGKVPPSIWWRHNTAIHLWCKYWICWNGTYMFRVTSYYFVTDTYSIQVQCQGSHLISQSLLGFYIWTKNKILPESGRSRWPGNIL